MYHGDKVLDVLLAFTLPKLLEPCVILIRCYIHKKILLSLLLHLVLDILPFMFYDLFVCYCRCRGILKHSTNLQVMFTMEHTKKWCIGRTLSHVSRSKKHRNISPKNKEIKHFVTWIKSKYKTYTYVRKSEKIADSRNRTYDLGAPPTHLPIFGVSLSGFEPANTWSIFTLLGRHLGRDTSVL